MLPRLHPSAAPTLSAPPQRQLALKYSSFSSEQVVWKGIQRVSMASIRALLYVGAFMAAAWGKTTGGGSIPTAQNVRWVSKDFITVLLWDMEESEYTCTVLFTEGTKDWTEAHDCIQISDSECEMTEYLLPLDRDYKADIRTEGSGVSYDYGSEDFPHTYTKTTLNPYRESNITALSFSLLDVNESTVVLNISHPLSFRGRTIKDVLRNDLKYKISYYKSGSTGKREQISDSSNPVVSGLDPGQSYCFMVAAFIPSRPQATQLGVWSTQQCREGHALQELSLGAWVGITIILIIVFMTFITVTALCCRKKHRRNRNLQAYKSSSPI